MHATQLWKYTTRITPAISLSLLVVLLSFSLVTKPFGTVREGKHHGNATIWQLLLSAQVFILHILSLLFPIRAVYAIVHVTKEMNKTAVAGWDDKGLSSLGPLPLFVIIIPTYKEDVETLNSTLAVLASHPMARGCYHIYLAMEERENNAVAKYECLTSTWTHCFLGLSFTLHPSGLPNEAPGKSSNENWAVQQVCRDYPCSTRKRDIIVTTMDADTHLSPRYFAQITQSYLASSESRATTMYMPPLVFDRNLHRIPLLVRTADIMWACAGISSMYSGSMVSIPTSVYSLPLGLVEKVGGWDCDYGSLGEDMHMFLKCFFSLSGNLNVQVIYAAASQCNTSSSLMGIRGYFDCMWARYQQAIRHMWGALDTGFAIRQFAAMLNASSSATLASIAYKTDVGAQTIPPLRIHKRNVLTVFHRLFEAHFLPAQLVLVLLASGRYNLVYPSFLMPSVLRTTLGLCGVFRLLSFGIMMCFFYRYERYHRLCIGLRREEMRKAGLLDEMDRNDAFSPNVFLRAGMIEAMVFPFGGIIFGAIPAFQAVISHVFTERLTYVVSSKPQLFGRRAQDGTVGNEGVDAASEALSLSQQSWV